MNVLGIVLTLLFVTVVWRATRQTAALGVFATACYLTQGQQLDLAGFHFTAIRIVLLVGFIRVVSRKEINLKYFNAIDKCLIAYTISVLVIYTIRNGTVTAFFYQTGCAYDAFLSYFVFRGLLPTQQQAKAVLPRLAVIILPFALFMLLEAVSGRNLFAVFGGVPEMAWIRGEHFRARASFRSPITAGCLGSCLAAPFVACYLAGATKRPLVVGFLACVAIVLASHSSGPLMGLLAGLAGLGLWGLRDQMKLVRRVLVCTVIGLHLMMQAPVWFLIARMGEVTGGDAYHRAELIDQFVRHFNSWWLLGTSDTINWMATSLNGGADITNQLVAAGIDGGIIAVFLFVLLVGKCFQQLGKARKTAGGEHPNDEWFLWGLGSALFAHLVNLTSVTYFDQMQVVWFLTLAMISSAAAGCLCLQDRDAAEESPARIQSNGTVRAALQKY